MQGKSKRAKLVAALTAGALVLVSLRLLYQQMPPRLTKSACLQSFPAFDTPEAKWLFNFDATSDWFPDGVRGDNVSGYSFFIVPNIVHYILIDVFEITFVHYISIKTVLANHKPDRVLIHSNNDYIIGKYWQLLMSDASIKEKLTIRKIEKPLTVYGLHYSQQDLNYHLSDVMRNKILMEFGGIYLDRDMYIVKSLNEFRKFEMTLGFDEGCDCMGTQIQIAHKRARFLRLYLQTYQKYDSTQWYWNAGKYPTVEVLDKYPHLVHRMNNEFGVTSEIMCEKLYKQNDNNWQNDYYAIHMLMRGHDIEHTKWCFTGVIPAQTYFDELNIKSSRTTFGQMARLVFFNTTDLLL